MCERISGITCHTILGAGATRTISRQSDSTKQEVIASTQNPALGCNPFYTPLCVAFYFPRISITE